MKMGFRNSLSKINKLLSDTNIYMALGVAIALSVVLVSYKVTVKSGYHVDELWSYGLANSYDRPQLCNFETYNVLPDGGYNVWFTANDYREYLTVQEGEEFAYDKVIYNQSNDSHPPLYYMLLHTICSLFVNKYSPWFAIVINIVFYIGTQLVLFYIGLRVLKSNKKALIAMIMWSFSAGGIGCAAFMRMYMMYTFFTILFFYLNGKIIEKNEMKLSDCITIFVSCTCGMLTHNYFYVFIFCSFIFITVMYIKRNKYIVFKYLFSVILAIVVSLLIFPEEIKVVFFSGKGKKAFDSLKYFFTSGKSTYVYFSSLVSDYFGVDIVIAEYIIDTVWFIFYIGLVVGSICFIYKIIKKEVDVRKVVENSIRKVFRILSEHKELSSIMAISLMYAFIVSRICPYMPYFVDRYFFNIMPLFSIVLIFFLNNRKWKKDRLITYIFICSLILSNITTNRYIQINKWDKTVFCEEVKGKKCYLIEDFGCNMNQLCEYFLKSDRVFFTNMEYYGELCNEITKESDLSESVLIIDGTKKDSESIIKLIQNDCKCKLNFVYETKFNDTYCLYTFQK